MSDSWLDFGKAKDGLDHAAKVAFGLGPVLGRVFAVSDRVFVTWAVRITPLLIAARLERDALLRTEMLD
jgi:hypothetical protein